MAKICREAEASIDYYSLFKAIMKRTPLPMTPLESLASSAVGAEFARGVLPLGCSWPALALAVLLCSAVQCSAGLCCAVLC